MKICNLIQTFSRYVNQCWLFWGRYEHNMEKGWKCSEAIVARCRPLCDSDYQHGTDLITRDSHMTRMTPEAYSQVRVTCSNYGASSAQPCSHQEPSPSFIGLKTDPSSLGTGVQYHPAFLRLLSQHTDCYWFTRRMCVILTPSKWSLISHCVAVHTRDGR